MKFFRKEVIKRDRRNESDRHAVYDMIKSDGWKVSFKWAMEALRDIKDIRNVPEKNSEVEVKARQLFINMLESHYESIYGIVINNESINEEDEGSELYSVLKGNESVDENEF